MARYVYTGPEESRGDVPSFEFDEGLVYPPRLREMVEAGHVVRTDVETAPAPVEAAPETVSAPEGLTETPAPKERVRPPRPGTRPATKARK